MNINFFLRKPAEIIKGAVDSNSPSACQDIQLLKLYFDLTDRAQRERFEGYYVVNFYGEPGIGKSALLRQIESRLQTEAKALPKKERPVILRADFDNPALSSETKQTERTRQRQWIRMANGVPGGWMN